MTAKAQPSALTTPIGQDTPVPWSGQYPGRLAWSQTHRLLVDLWHGAGSNRRPSALLGRGSEDQRLRNAGQRPGLRSLQGDGLSDTLRAVWIAGCRRPCDTAQRICLGGLVGDGLGEALGVSEDLGSAPGGAGR